MSSGGGWSRTVVRCGGSCGAEVASVYREGAELVLRGSGAVDGSRVLNDADGDLIPLRCPKCGRAGSFTPSVLTRAARTGRRALAIR
jgi:DNA-directed RNA polymerase subunit N (RpoN/RPB10)